MKRFLFISKKHADKVAVGATALLVSATSSAAVDPAVTTAISDAQADIVTVGSAIIVMAAAAMGIRWVKATFF